MSAPMVRAILDGRKTQTRRIVKPMSAKQAKWLTPGVLASVPSARVCRCDEGDRNVGAFGVALAHPQGGPLGWVRCPYGAPGDRLWVRETWRESASLGEPIGYAPAATHYRADLDEDAAPGQWRPSIFMPRFRSRIKLDVVSVRVERLQEITEEDARAEGAPPGVPHEWPWVQPDFRGGLERLWDEINGARAAWSSNPWVWVITFARLDGRKP